MYITAIALGLAVLCGCSDPIVDVLDTTGKTRQGHASEFKRLVGNINPGAELYGSQDGKTFEPHGVIEAVLPERKFLIRFSNGDTTIADRDRYLEADCWYVKR